ncbi:MAG: M14 family metallopeptidase [Salibacteraceae bacterium]
MKNISAFWCVAAICFASCNHAIDPGDFETAYTKSNGLETETYESCIAWWKRLAEASPYVKISEAGSSDAPYPIHTIVVSATKNFSPENAIRNKKLVWLINNGIHPGEPDGIDATMLFVRDLLADIDFAQNYRDLVMVIVPVYNIGGALRRNAYSRANQNGPLSYGFRGNARNLDLNRDFIKCDSRNASTFSHLFTGWMPHIYTETHVSNGADYPYTMTFLHTHPDKLHPRAGSLLKDTLAQALFTRMEDRGDKMIPYVNVFGTSPDSGYSAFIDLPRYSTGYAALFGTLGFLTETHMLKPFKKRVKSTLRFLHAALEIIHHHRKSIEQAVNIQRKTPETGISYPINWEVDFTKYTPLDFEGYRAYYDTSRVTRLPQLYYDTNVVWRRKIPYFDKLKQTNHATLPKAYLVPLAWQKLIDVLKANRIRMSVIENDTLLPLTVYRIETTQTLTTPFEGHYQHHDTKVSAARQNIRIRAGQYAWVATDQPAWRYLLETLEPEAPDSYFNWNFFDEILTQKEWFSPYVFDKIAAQIMLDNDSLRYKLDDMRLADSAFASISFAQLYFIYKNSDFYESGVHMIYPVYKWN